MLFTNSSLKFKNHLNNQFLFGQIILTCLVALSRQQQPFPGFGNTFGNLGNAFGNAFNAIFTNSANQLTNSVRPLGSPGNNAAGFGPNFQQRPPANGFNSPGFFAAVRPIPGPTNRPVTIAPVVRPTGVPVTPVVRPTGSPVVPVNRPTGSPVVPVNRPTGSAVTGRKRRTVVEKVVDTPAAYTADNDTPKPITTTEAPSSYWPVPGAGWFYG